jgi:peptidoglycan hydrolase CwlO-like protein
VSKREEGSFILEAPTEKVSAKVRKPAAKRSANMTALRNQAKEIRGEITEIRKSRTTANQELREAQKKVKEIDSLILKRQRALDRVKARIDSGSMS